MNFYILDRNNHPESVSINSWKHFWHARENLLRKIIGEDLVENYSVITFFHTMLEVAEGGKVPALFESYVLDIFTNDIVYSTWYKTWEEAVKGHQKAIDWTRENFIPSIGFKI